MIIRQWLITRLHLVETKYLGNLHHTQYETETGEEIAQGVYIYSSLLKYNQGAQFNFQACAQAQRKEDLMAPVASLLVGKGLRLS